MSGNVRRTPRDVKANDKTAGRADAPRTRRPRNSLSQDAILDAAEKLAAQGFDAVTMRSVAAELGSAPMALYNHFATKDLLVDALLDRVLSRFKAPSTSEDWVEDLRRLALAHRRVLVDHPWAVAPLFIQPNPGFSSVRIGELGLKILCRGGLSTTDAVAAFGGIIALNYGWASFTTARDFGPEGRGGEVAALLKLLPVDDYPLTVAAADDFGAYGSDAHYQFVLDQLLIGLRETAPRHPR